MCGTDQYAPMHRLLRKDCGKDIVAKARRTWKGQIVMQTLIVAEDSDSIETDDFKDIQFDRKKFGSITVPRYKHAQATKSSNTAFDHLKEESIHAHKVQPASRNEGIQMHHNPLIIMNTTATNTRRFLDLELAMSLYQFFLGKKFVPEADERRCTSTKTKN